MSHSRGPGKSTNQDRLARIVKYLGKNPDSTILSIATACRLEYNIAFQEVLAMVKAGLIEEKRVQHFVVYTLPKKRG